MNIFILLFIFSVAYIDSWKQIFRLLQMCHFITRLYLLETALQSFLVGETLQRNMLKNNKLNVCNCKYKNIVPQLPAVFFHAGSLEIFISFSGVLTPFYKHEKDASLHEITTILFKMGLTLQLKVKFGQRIVI